MGFTVRYLLGVFLVLVVFGSSNGASTWRRGRQVQTTTPSSLPNSNNSDSSEESSSNAIKTTSTNFTNPVILSNSTTEESKTADATSDQNQEKTSPKTDNSSQNRYLNNSTTKPNRGSKKFVPNPAELGGISPSSSSSIQNSKEVNLKKIEKLDEKPVQERKSASEKRISKVEKQPESQKVIEENSESSEHNEEQVQINSTQRSDKGRSLEVDINKYTSPEFHNTKNLFQQTAETKEANVKKLEKPHEKHLDLQDIFDKPVQIEKKPESQETQIFEEQPVQETQNNSTQKEDSNLEVDIKKYTSPEFHNQRNVYELTISPETKEFLNPNFEVSNPKPEPYNYSYFATELTTPITEQFDSHFRQVEDKVKQNLEYIDHVAEDNDHKYKFAPEDHDVDKLLEESKKNDAKVNLDVTKYRNLTADDVKGEMSLHKDLSSEEAENSHFNSSYNKTVFHNDPPIEDKNQIAVDEREPVKLDPNFEDGEEGGIAYSHSQVEVVHKKDVVTPSSKNSKLSIFNNTIETEIIKPVEIAEPTKPTTLPTVPLQESSRQFTEETVVAVTKRGPFPPTPIEIPANFGIGENATFDKNNFTIPPTATAWTLVTYKGTPGGVKKTENKTKEQLAEENQVYSTQIKDLKNQDIINETTEKRFTLPATTTTFRRFSIIRTTNFSSSFPQLTEAITRTPVPSMETITGVQFNSQMQSDTTPPTISTTEEVKTEEAKTEEVKTEEQSTLTTEKIEEETTTTFTTETVESPSTENPETTTIEEKETIAASNNVNNKINTSDDKENTIINPLVTTSLKQATTTPIATVVDETNQIVKQDTSTPENEEDDDNEDGEEIHDYSENSPKSVSPTTTMKIVKTLTTPLHKRVARPNITTSYEVMTPAIKDVTVNPEEVDSTTADNWELEGQNGPSGGTIAAIIISSIGAICLVLLAILLFVMRKRHKRFNYGQRCTPVSLDAYSVDNVSVYNSVRRKAIRASKRSYGNPAFEDPSSVSRPLDFPGLAKFAGNLEAISSEFEEIPQVTAQTNELPEGCETKNRYANVIPLPETRVFLNAIDGVVNSDYINANYVTGAKNARGYYIACQAPMQNTVDDFWRMVWEQQSKVVLMITHLFENGVEKCIDYLPPSEVLDCHRLFGDYQVTLKKQEVKEKYVISTLQLKNMVSNSWREITHLWYMGWPEKGVPGEANSLIAYLIEARSYMKPSNDNNKKRDPTNGHIKIGANKAEINPVIVHCSPGTGRTGTVIACDIAIREFEMSRHVDIPKTVYRIRRDRASSVQTKDQYAYIYKVITLYATKLTGGVFDTL